MYILNTIYLYVLYKLLELNTIYSGYLRVLPRDNTHTTQEEINYRAREYELLES